MGIGMVIRDALIGVLPREHCTPGGWHFYLPRGLQMCPFFSTRRDECLLYGGPAGSCVGNRETMWLSSIKQIKFSIFQFSVFQLFNFQFSIFERSQVYDARADTDLLIIQYIGEIVLRLYCLLLPIFVSIRMLILKIDGVVWGLHVTALFELNIRMLKSKYSR